MVTRADLPMMASCLGCHNGQSRQAGGKQATARCGACHLTEPDGRLQVKLATPATIAAGGVGLLQPSGSLRGFDAHGPTFRRDHAQAGRDESYCLSCHRRNECVDCHGGVVKPPDIHPADYVTLHVPDARRNVPDCSSCHRLQTFCIGCHQRTGVASDPTGGLPGGQAPEPVRDRNGGQAVPPAGLGARRGGPVIATPRPQSHSVQAKRNIRTCVSCHREESCLACHSSRPDPGAQLLAPRPQLRGHRPLPVPGGPQPARLPQVSRHRSGRARLPVAADLDGAESALISSAAAALALYLMCVCLVGLPGDARRPGLGASAGSVCSIR